MSLTETLSWSDRKDGVSSISGTVTEVGNTRVEVNENFPAASANALVTVAFTVAAMQSLFLLSNQNMTIYTNTSGGGGGSSDTITLKAGIPLLWDVSGYFANPLTHNVTALYISCTPAATLQMRVLTS